MLRTLSAFVEPDSVDSCSAVVCNIGLCECELVHLVTELSRERKTGYAELRGSSARVGSAFGWPRDDMEAEATRRGEVKEGHVL